MFDSSRKLELLRVKENEAKIFRRKYGTVSGQFLGLVETLGYLTVRGDSVKCFFDYGYSKVRSCTATKK